MTADLTQLTADPPAAAEGAAVTADLTQLTADLESHHIEGIAVHGNTPFRAPLVSHIAGNLWVGGYRDGVRLPDDFAHVVSLYPWETYELGPDTTILEVQLYDAADEPDPRVLYQVAGYVLGCLREGRVLVHCQAGLNRSNLVAGLALVLDGMDPEAAIALLRERRSPAVLCNPVFAEWLRAQRTGVVVP